MFRIICSDLDSADSQ